MRSRQNLGWSRLWRMTLSSPRESGISSKPMKQSVKFVSPETMRVTLELPHRGKITGMGVPKGITLIVGGGYHGKSTLLNALELGVYNHIAGDGREYVIADETAQKLRSEDGRFIKNVDISMFINDLPNGRDTKDFSTADASGSTSQAAGIVEAIEAGSRLLLLDEDTSATNFMVRDAFMQKVVSPDKEPITPFLSRARDLYEKQEFPPFWLREVQGHFSHCRHCDPDGSVRTCGYHRESEGTVWTISDCAGDSKTICFTG